MNLFDFTEPAPAGSSKAEVTRRIKQWVEELRVLGDEGVVHVAELQCHEPGCPDFETVITLMYAKPGMDRTVKVFKSLTEVTEEEVRDAILKSFADGSPAVAALKAELDSGHHC